MIAYMKLRILLKLWSDAFLLRARWGRIFILDFAVIVSLSSQFLPSVSCLCPAMPIASSSLHSPRYNQYPTILQSPSVSFPHNDTASPSKLLVQHLCIPFSTTPLFSP